MPRFAKKMSKALTSPPMREIIEVASAGRAARAMEWTVSSSCLAIFVFDNRDCWEEKAKGKRKKMISSFFSLHLLSTILQTNKKQLDAHHSHNPRHFQKLPFLLRSLPQGVGGVPAKLRDLVGAERKRLFLFEFCSCLFLRSSLLLR